MFPLSLEELVPWDHLCGVIDAFVGRLDFQALGFERAEAAETGRRGYDPRDLLKLYLYGYLQQVRSSRRLESECRRNVELMWLLGRLVPDHKSIAGFRRLHREAVTEAGAELVRLARSVGLVRGEWVAIDGSKFQAVTSARGIVPHVPAQRGINNQGDGTLLDRSQFHYDDGSDTFRCPGGQTPTRKQVKKDRRCVLYTASAATCGACALKSQCTPSRQRYVQVHLHDAALERMRQRATAAVMRLRRCTAEHPFATLKYRIFGHPRLVLRGVQAHRPRWGWQ